MDQYVYGIVGDKDVVDGGTLITGTAGNAVEGVDTGGSADGCDLGAVGENLFHILDRFAMCMGVEVTRDENGKGCAVLLA